MKQEVRKIKEIEKVEKVEKLEKKIFAILGPTATGKTNLAIELVKKYPFEIISVDSAMVYKNMDIGTAKPSHEELKSAPHHLINLCSPDQIYSVADFCRDATLKIQEIFSRNHYPLLVGGTMMYFNALKNGLSQLPSRDENLRQEFLKILNQEGLPALFNLLKNLDPQAAERLKPQDTQRIIRALEIFKLSGKSMFDPEQELEKSTQKLTYPWCAVGLITQDLEWQKMNIKNRFLKMLDLGFIQEVKDLKNQFNLNQDLPSMRSVGYRQVWGYLDQQLTYDQMIERSLIATAQLAKRQRTWLRSFDWVELLNPSDLGLLDQVCSKIDSHLSSPSFEN